MDITITKEVKLWTLTTFDKNTNEIEVEISVENDIFHKVSKFLFIWSQNGIDEFEIKSRMVLRESIVRDFFDKTDSGDDIFSFVLVDKIISINKHTL